MTGTIIQIVPVRSTAPEGVGDYARLLAERLLSEHGLRTIFVSGTPLPAERRLIDAWETQELRTRSAHALLATLAAVGPNVPILLHLSAYGFHPKGTPFWLVSAMARWRRANPATPLVTVFHELFATGPFWRSAFWVGPVQAHVARRMQKISTAGTTTTEPYADLLRKWRGRHPGETIAMPVFSTIGESDDVVPAPKRPRSLAIFGRSDTIYRDRLQTVESFVSANQITEIIDIGRRNTPPPGRIGGVAVRSLGEIPGERIRHELAGALFGMLDYDADRLAKSTVFAAYCANGAIPLCLSAHPGTQDGLVPGLNYLKLDETIASPAPDAAALESLQQAAKDWYLTHSLSASTDVIVKLLRSAPEAEGI